MPTSFHGLYDLDVGDADELAVLANEVASFAALVGVRRKCFAAIDGVFHATFESGLASIVQDVSNAADVFVDVLCVGNGPHHVRCGIGSSCDSEKLGLSGDLVDLVAEDLADVFGVVLSVETTTLLGELKEKNLTVTIVWTSIYIQQGVLRTYKAI